LPERTERDHRKFRQPVSGLRLELSISRILIKLTCLY